VVPDNEDVDDPRSEGMLIRVFNMNDIMSTHMPLPSRNNTNPPNVTATRNHALRPDVELDMFPRQLVILQIKLDGIIGFDEGVGVSNCAAIVRDDVRHTPKSQGDAFDFEEFVFGFVFGDAVDYESTFGVVDDSEVFFRTFDGDDIHEASGEPGISSDFIIHLDESLEDDIVDLPSIQGVF